jgi:peroxiredoxin Q/BCP
VQILGISFDSVDDNRKFAEKYKFNYPLLCDVDRKVGVAYGAADPGSTGTAARIAYLIGADGKIEKSYGKVKPNEFVEQAFNSCG